MLASWRNRWRAWRNRRLLDPAFQRKVAGFFPTRFRARREAEQTFDLVAGFVYSQVILACQRLAILEALRDGPLAESDLQARIDLPPAALLTLLRAAAALDLLEYEADSAAQAGRWWLGQKGAALLGNPGVLAMIEHHAVLYRDLADPVACLRAPRGETELARYWPYAVSDEPQAVADAAISDYTRLMSASQGLVADEILDAYDVTRHRCVLDIGGGDGTFLRHVAARHRAARLELFDLPAVAAQAETRFALAGLADRAHCTGGDFACDDLPQGADLICLVRVLHDHDDPLANLLLKRAYAALPPGGVLLVAEPLADTPGARRMGGAYFGMYLWVMGSGRPRSASELQQMLTDQGFTQLRCYSTRIPLQTSVWSACKPRALP